MTREQVLALQGKLKTQTVDVPEWEGSITIRELTAEKAMALGTVIRVDDRESMVLWVIASAIDEAGNRLFQDGDKEALSQMSAAAILRIGNAAIKLSGFGAEEAKN